MALLDEAAETIEFPFYSENGGGSRRTDRLGEGLTSRILQAREPLLLNSDAQFEESARGLGTLAGRISACPSMWATERSG